ncbi:MAG: hypothetical protein L6Q59_04585 [Ignavibacteriaceae bacterium]|nr:hypothetical protein [Ignavibacteriaceae bacterium]
MASVTIEESGSIFEFELEDYLNLEKSNLYFKELMNHGVLVCDFILKVDCEYHFTEVKSSAPKDNDEYCEKISKKINHSLMMLSSLILKKIKSEEKHLSDFTDRFDPNYKFRGVLIVDLKKDHLIGLQEKMNKIIKPISKIYKMEKFLVLNFDNAKQKHYRIKRVSN